MTARPFPYSALIFDFDGTLASLTLDFALMQAAGLTALRRFVPIAPEETRLSLEDVKTYCAALPHGPAAAARAAVHEAFQSVEVAAAARSGLFPFVRPMLGALASAGVKTAIITRNCRAAVHTVFPDIAEHPILLLTREDVAEVKPHPEHLLAVLREFSCSPKKALMVGDHSMDIQAGKNAGTATAGVGSGQVSLAALAQARPEYLAPDVGALMQELGLQLNF